MRSDAAGRIAAAYGLTEADRRRVLEFFGEPKRYYTVAEAAAWIGTSVEEVEYHLEETILRSSESGAYHCHMGRLHAALESCFPSRNRQELT